MKQLLLALFAAQLGWAQTQVPLLVPNTTLHDHYLFNRSNTYDSQDYSGLPWLFYFTNVGSSPAPTTFRTRCEMVRISGAPYPYLKTVNGSGATSWSWFRYPVPGGNGSWPAADGEYVSAVTGEYLESAQFSTSGSTENGFQFTGEFAGVKSPPSTFTEFDALSYFLESVYFTDRECSDGGTEYGFYRYVALSNNGAKENPTIADMPPTSIGFYYSEFANCNIDYGCWDNLGHQVFEHDFIAAITNLTPTKAGTYEYTFQALRTNSGEFNISILDPAGDTTIDCTWVFNTGGGSSGPCTFSAPIASWYPPASQTQKGYIAAATQSSHLYGALTGDPYPEWYDYGSRGYGAPPPTDVLHTPEPGGGVSCLTSDRGYACLNVRSLEALYK